MKNIVKNINGFIMRPFGLAVCAIIYTFMFGCAFPLVKICIEQFGISADDNVSKCLLAGVRFFLSGLILVFICRKNNADKRKALSYSFLYGIFGTTLKYACTYIGLSLVTGSKGAILDQMGVFLLVIFSGLFFKGDRLSFLKIIGCILGLLGIVAVGFEGLNFSFSFMGEGMIILAAFFNTLEYFVAKFASDKVSSAELVGKGQLIGGILLMLIALLLGGRFTSVTVKGVLSLTALVIISSFAYTLSLMPLKYHPVSKVTIYNLLITVFGVIMSGIVLRENIFKIEYIVAIALISVGIFVINKQQERE
ncbi:MAG: DMT family transporter [Acutalibacteraceae bacterium]|nr:DMT family transporter [Acutalibacteraceae bacterium]